ncbi:MAG: hemerythrin domain-containing protein [Desulfobacterales bacterium]|jgi:hemerythrin-like domain-containing protein
MNPIDELLAEHEAVKTTLKILKRIGEDVAKSGKIANPEHLAQILDFLITFVDRCHHSKEEEQLFPALEEVGVSREGGPVGVMLKEHQQGRALLAEMKTASDQSKSVDKAATQNLIQHANNYITLLEFHIDKENNVLFPMAAKHLSESKMVELKKGFDRIEEDKIGAGKHEYYHQMLDALKKEYLS